MFRKPFTVKSNTNLRNSDGRKLVKRLHEKTAENVPKKAAIAHVPLFFDDNPAGMMVPTLYEAWNDPGCCPILVIPQQAFSFLENGADLMLPGVIINEAFQMPYFEKGTPIGVAVLDKQRKVRGPFAIGIALLSSTAMQSARMQGKGVQILHTFHDHLWEMGPRNQPPILEPDVFQRQMGIGLVEELQQDVEELHVSDEAAAQEPRAAVEENVGEQEAGPVDTEPVEQLLERCFLAGLRYRLGKSAALPVDVGQFYSTCVLKCLPEGKRLDVKKSKYKKFGTFLTEINKNDAGPILTINSKGKGVDVITEINWEHPRLTRFKITDERIRDEEATGGQANKKIFIAEFLAVTEPMMPLLNATGSKWSRGELVQPYEIKDLVTGYVKKENLNDGKMVKLDPMLSSISTVANEKTDWNTLLQKIQSRMTKTFVMTLPDGREMVKKLKMPTVVFKLETRSGQKKVTIVNNLAAFGLDAKEIAHTTQVAVAASAATAESPLSEGLQIVVQGNQVGFISELLMKTYGLERKYMDGLELAVKKKNYFACWRLLNRMDERRD
ncbi:unnamed protein product, partial [Mesorhabditis spiculigera]